MAVPKMRGSLSALTPSRRRGLVCGAACVAALCIASLSAGADEIRLKDGKKLYGVIVAYEDNMFKVKTDFGYVLVEKDKIASIVPSTPTGEAPKSDEKVEPKTDKTDAARKDPAKDATPKAEPAVASSTNTATATTNASAKSADPPAAGRAEKTAPKITNAAAKPEIPAPAKTNAVPPAIKGAGGAPVATAGAAPNTALSATASQPEAPKEPEPPAIREDVQGSVYTNYTHGFKMYKAPSFSLMEDARKALPNAIVALGTLNQSTLLVIGQEPS
ncbi:MAG TPA: hypothetical protein VGI46_02225, partial [Candidatus Acidoferrum sp.]